MQLAPNAIAILMAFLVICHRVGVEPTLQLFSQLVGVKASKKDAHFFFVNLGEKLVLFPESNRRWKEKFVWVFGADPILPCSSWPEIKKETLKPLPLTDSEYLDLEKIRAYAGSRDMSNLFDNSSLRVAGLSHTTASEVDVRREAVLTQAASGLALLPETSGGRVAPKAPVKKVRKAGFTPEELEFLKKNSGSTAARFAVPSRSPEGLEKKKRKRTEKAHPGGAGAEARPKKAGKSAAGASAPAPPKEVVEEMAAVEELSHEPMELANSPRNGMDVGRDISAPGGSPVEPTGGEEPVPDVVTETATEAASSSQPTERDPSTLLFPHSLGDVRKEKWKEMRGLLIGTLAEGFTDRGEPAEVKKFVPDRVLREDDSVMQSGRAQYAALRQFTLPKDAALLEEVPSRGLHYSLLSYQLRGALVADELAGRLEQAVIAHGHLSAGLAGEKKAREEAEQRVGLLEAELAGVNARRAQEVESNQALIRGLEATQARLSASLEEVSGQMVDLKGRSAELESELELSHAAISDREARLQSLREELAAEKSARSAAEAEASSTQQALQKSLETARSEISSLEARLAQANSEERKRDIIEEFRQGPLGKVEVALAVKAGIDFLKGRLSASALSSSDLSYPSRVRNCIDVLEDLEAQGGGIPLDSEDEDEGDEDDDDESGEGGSGGGAE